MPYKQCRRDNKPGHAHALTFSCYDRLPLLARDRTRLWLTEAIGAAREKARFDLWAYVIMPEHAHVLLRPCEPSYDISRVLWLIKRPVGRQALRYLEAHAPDRLPRLTTTRRDGTTQRHFWQAGGGYDRNISDATTARNVIDYVHLNPVRRGLVARAEDWEWSSARWYAGLHPVLLGIDPTLPRTYEP